MQTTNGVILFDKAKPQPAAGEVKIAQAVSRVLRPHPEPRGPLMPHFDMENETVKQLLEDGVAIVRACSAERADALRSGFWDDLEALGTGIERNDPDTWNNSNWPQTTHGLLQNQHWGLRESVCEARLECVEAFKGLFGNQLVNSSFDAVSVARPDSQQRAFTKEVNLNERYGESELLSSWLHFDQSNLVTGVAHHVQSALALEDLGEAEQRTHFVIPPKGTTIQEFRDRFLDAFPLTEEAKSSDAERDEWISLALKAKVEDTDPLVLAKRKWLLEHGRVYTPTLKKGELVFWLSAVPHASIPGPCPEGQERKVRISAFVCMKPSVLVDEKHRATRDAMLEDLQTSGHGVTSDGKNGKPRRRKFVETGRTYGKALPKFKKDRVVKASKRALAASGAPDWSVARKTQRLCAGAGL